MKKLQQIKKEAHSKNVLSNDQCHTIKGGHAFIGEEDIDEL